VIPLCPQISATVADYHNVGVVHGDIKLGNMLFRKPCRRLARTEGYLSDLGTLNVLPEGALKVASR
jgi:serine/threonine protein kinase